MNADTSADEALAARIQDELDRYNDAFDISALPAGQQAQLGAIVDNLPQAAGGVRTLTATGGVIEATTDFPADGEGEVTGRLICGGIERGVGPDDPGGHRVLGADGAVLADCEPDDANYP